MGFVLVEVSKGFSEKVTQLDLKDELTIQRGEGVNENLRTSSSF